MTCIHRAMFDTVMFDNVNAERLFLCLFCAKDLSIDNARNDKRKPKIIKTMLLDVLGR